MWILRTSLLLLGRVLWLGGLVVVTVSPEELKRSLADAETNVAAYLELIGLDKLAKNVPEQTDSALGAVLVIVAAYLVCKWWLRRHTDAKAIRHNPGNGWRVARQIMRTRTISQARALFMDFEAVEAERKAHELEVLAAYALRWWRTGMEEGGAQVAAMERLALSRGLGGRYPFLEAYRRLDREFPEFWWARLRHKLAKRTAPKRVPVQPGNVSFGPMSATVNLSVMSLPKWWRNPIKWVWWKRTKSNRYLIRNGQ